MCAFLKRAAFSYDDEWEFELPISTIDIVFLLLIFFMCTARFRSDERILASRLPRDRGPDLTREEIEPPVELVVKIFWESPSGEAVADPVPGCRVAILAGSWRCADPNELARTLSSLKGRHERTPVVIDARRRVPFAWVLGAVDACARAGIRNVTFRAPARTGLGSEWWRL